MLTRFRWLLSGVAAGCLSLPAFAQFVPQMTPAYQYPMYPPAGYGMPMQMPMLGAPMVQVPMPPVMPMPMVRPVAFQQAMPEAVPSVPAAIASHTAPLTVVAPDAAPAAAAAPGAAPEGDAQRIGRLEAEVASLKSQLTSPSTVLHNDCCNTACKTGGIVGGVESLWLRPVNSEGVAPLFDAVIDLVNGLGIPGVVINEPEFSYEPAWRLWIGYEFADGFGVRTRYFQFDHTATATSVFPGGVVTPLNLAYGLETHVFDLELTDALRLGDKWNLLLSAGFRYVEYREVNTADITIVGLTPITLATGFESQSYGMTIGGELRRPIGQRFAFFGSARGSVLFGKEDEVLVIGIPGLLGAGGIDLTEREDDNVKSILELQIGGQWNYELSNGSLFFVRGSVEGQIWNNFSGVPILNSSASTGFFGFGIGVGLSR